MRTTILRREERATLLIQYGAIPVRREGDGRLSILLVTSRETRRWVVPRGNPIFGLSPARSAAQEAWEEAGVRGRIESEPVGSYHYGKRRKHGETVPAEVQLFRLEVAELAERWPESGQRERRWFAPDAAAAAVDEPELKRLLAGLEGGG
jgi:8-oxo-dGTP pyrophosphatase MutT (NUDIX family)